MVAERTLDRLLLGTDRRIPRSRSRSRPGTLSIAGQASHQLDRTAAQKPGQQILVQIVRHRSRRGVSVGGIAAQTVHCSARASDGRADGKPGQCLSPVLCTCQCIPVDRSEKTCIRYMPTLRTPLSGSTVWTSGKVTKRPPSNGQHFRTGSSESRTSSPVRTTCWASPPRPRRFRGQPARHPLQQRQHAELVGQRRFRKPCQLRQQALHPPGQVVETFHAQRQGHPAVGAHHASSQDGERRARPLEQQRPTASRTFRLAVGQLGDLQHRIDLGGDSHQLAGALQRGDIFPKIPIHDSICSFLTHCHTGPEYPSAHNPISRSCPPERRDGQTAPAIRKPARPSYAPPECASRQTVPRQPHARQATTGRPASERNARASFPDRLRSVRHRRSGKTDTQRRSYDPSDALRLSASGRKSRYSYPLRVVQPRQRLQTPQEIGIVPFASRPSPFGESRQSGQQHILGMVERRNEFGPQVALHADIRRDCSAFKPSNGSRS